MLEWINTGRIVDAFDRLTGEVRSLRYEIGHHRDELARHRADLGRHRDETGHHRQKLGPQPEWLLFMILAGVTVLTVALVIIAAASKEPMRNDEPPRTEQQVELPDPARG